MSEGNYVRVFDFQRWHGRPDLNNICSKTWHINQSLPVVRRNFPTRHIVHETNVRNESHSFPASPVTSRTPGIGGLTPSARAARLVSCKQSRILPTKMPMHYHCTGKLPCARVEPSVSLTADCAALMHVLSWHSTPASLQRGLAPARHGILSTNADFGILCRC